MRRRLWFVGLLALSGAQCRSAGPDAIQAAATALPEPIAAFDAVGALPTQLAGDVHWQRALAGDPMDLAALGRGQGAAALVGFISQGGRVALVALEALPFAEDVAESGADLCELLLRVQVQDRVPVLRAWLSVARATPAELRPLDKEARCLGAVSSGQGGTSSDLEFDLRSSLRQALEGLPSAASPAPAD